MRKLLILMLFALTSVLNVLNAQNYDFEVDGLYYAYRADWDCYLDEWRIIDGEVEVVYKEVGDNTSYSGTVVIPATVTYNGTSYRVTRIGDSAFYGCSGLTSVTIPESLNYIKSDVFNGCSGLSVIWNARRCRTDYKYNCNRVTIQSSTGYYRHFNNASLTTLTFGDKVEFIPDYLCYGSRGLTSVTIPNSVTSIGNSAFRNCSGLTSVEWNALECENFWAPGWHGVESHYGVDSYYGYHYYPPFSDTSFTAITFGSEVKHIPAYLCYGWNGLISVTIPDSVTHIGDGAFSGCSGLTSVTIPESVTGIGESAFRDCSSLTSVEWNARECEDFGSPHPAFGRPGDFNYTTSYDPPFSDLSCTSITFGSEVKRIPGYLCYGWSGLTSVTIPDSVTDIGPSAFAGCEGFTSITIPNGVTKIGDSAFYGCIGFTSVTIPASVRSMGDNPFYGCSGLTSVTSLSETPPSCEENILGYEDYYTIPLYVPSGSKPFYAMAQGWRKFTNIKEFEANTYTVTVLPNDTAMGLVTGGGSYKEGEQALLAAIPYKGYYFDRWDDGNTNNPRVLTVSGDTTITAIFAKDGGGETPNEASEADNFRVYVQDRTIHLSEDRGLVQVYNMAGQCVYNGHATAIPVPQSGVYIVAVGSQRFKVLVR